MKSEYDKVHKVLVSSYAVKELQTAIDKLRDNRPILYAKLHKEWYDANIPKLATNHDWKIAFAAFCIEKLMER